MRPARLGLLCAATVVAVMAAGCTTGEPAAGDAGASGSPGAAAATSGGSSGLDAQSKAACAELVKDISKASAQVAKAKKIGPPAGHSAVSAAYSAGAAMLYAHMIGAGDQVSAAAEGVATAMSDLADKYSTAPKKAPATKTLDDAVTQLKAVCAAS